MAAPESNARWREVQSLFADVVGLNPERREARLDGACQDDPRLRIEVTALLDRYERGQDVVSPSNGPAPESTARLRASEELPPEHPTGGEPATGVVEKPTGALIAGRYRLLEELGRGAMGVVHKALDNRLDRFVALKFLSSHLGADRQARARLSAEAKAVSSLDHPNICTLYEIGETEDDRLFLVMAFYEGETLEQVIERGAVPSGEAKRLAIQLAEGLGAAHNCGIVHRDVKPSNLLITADGDLKILDFGIAKVTGSALTQTGDTLGTVEYMSPEQLRGEVDVQTDVWALGVVLYEMLSGRRPFGGDYEAALLYAILHEEPTPIRDLAAKVSVALERVVVRCLEKDPAKRFATAQEVASALASRERSSKASPARSWIPRARRTRGPRLVFVAGVAIAALTIALALPPGRAAISTVLSRFQSQRTFQQLAVLPFTVRSGDPNVAEGLRLELESKLSRLGPYAALPFAVIPAAHTRDIKTAEEARERLGVDLVVSGEFALDQDEVELVLEGPNLFTTIGGSAGEIVAVPAAMSDALIKQMDVELPLDVFASLEVEGTKAPRAYRNYLRGIAALDGYVSGTTASVGADRAIEMFLAALEDDSLYALAHAGLVDAYAQKYESTEDDVWIGLAERHATAALEIEEDLPNVHASLGHLYSASGDRSGAIREFERAAALGTSDADLNLRLGELYIELGQDERAEDHLRYAVELQPGSYEHVERLAIAYSNWGRDDDATSLLRRFVARVPSSAHGIERLAVHHWLEGDPKRAEAMFSRAVSTRPSVNTYLDLSDLYIALEMRERSIWAAKQATIFDSTRMDAWVKLAAALVRAESPDSTFHDVLHSGFIAFQSALAARTRYRHPLPFELQIEDDEQTTPLDRSDDALGPRDSDGAPLFRKTSGNRIRIRDADGALILGWYTPPQADSVARFINLEAWGDLGYPLGQSLPQNSFLGIRKSLLLSERFYLRTQSLSTVESFLRAYPSPHSSDDGPLLLPYDLWDYAELEDLRSDPRYQLIRNAAMRGRQGAQLN